MDIKKFDLKNHNLDIVADLILRAYSKSGHTFSYNAESREIVKDLIKSGNNFLGHENIYLCISGPEVAGLLVCYQGKSSSIFRALFSLLIKLKLTQMINYMILNSQILHSDYTPYMDEDDFYISVLTVDEKYRKQGLATLLLRKAALLAKERGCSRLILEVDNDNEAARSLYKKFGFVDLQKQNHANTDRENENSNTLIYSLH